MHSKMHQIILDTDPGIDDAMTFLFLKARSDVRIKAITTVFGNAHVNITTRNALYLRDRFKIAAPVFRGAADPLTIARRTPASHVHGADGFGDTQLSDGWTGTANNGVAYQELIRIIRDAPHQVSILAIAPLTNLALALQADPGIAKLVREVVVMGGAFGWGDRRGNVSPVAEANIANDPEAADIVLGAEWPVVMVGLDVTTSCILPAARAARMADAGGEAGRFLWDISRDYEKLYQVHDGVDGCCIHDVAAAMRMVEPDIFTSVSGPMRVVTGGIAAGQTIQKPLNQSFPPSAWDALPPQDACTTVDVKRLLDIYEAAILSLHVDDDALVASDRAT